MLKNMTGFDDRCAMRALVNNIFKNISSLKNVICR